MHKLAGKSRRTGFAQHAYLSVAVQVRGICRAFSCFPQEFACAGEASQDLLDSRESGSGSFPLGGSSKHCLGVEKTSAMEHAEKLISSRAVGFTPNARLSGLGFRTTVGTACAPRRTFVRPGERWMRKTQRLMDPQTATCLRSKTLAVRVKTLAMRVQ